MTTTIIVSFLGGVIPAVLWLKFWLKEAHHREPRKIIFVTFFFGMLSVFVAGILEQGVSQFVLEYSFLSFFLWALIEEILKYAGAEAGGLSSRFCEEAIDPAIYLITSALGFAAAENILFLFEPISNGDIITSIGTLSARFVGATLLHIIASGFVGIAIGFSFYKSKNIKQFALVFGILFATILHTIFNSFIIQDERYVIWVFASVWIGLIVVLFVLEKVKKIKQKTIIHK